jgi:hypothetical protein
MEKKCMNENYTLSNIKASPGKAKATAGSKQKKQSQGQSI